jgi:hypothetical protein
VAQVYGPKTYQRLDAKNALIGTTHVTYISKVILTGETTLNTRIRRKATNPENPIWIIVNVIGSGKLKYFGDRTHLLYSITPEERIM